MRIRCVGHPCPASSLFTFTASPPHCCMLTFLCPFIYPAHPRLNPVTHSQPNPAQITDWQRLQRTTARPAALQPPVRTPTLQPPQHQHWLRRPPHSLWPPAPPCRALRVRSCPPPHPRPCVQAPAASPAPPIQIRIQIRIRARSARPGPPRARGRSARSGRRWGGIRMGCR